MKITLVTNDGLYHKICEEINWEHIVMQNWFIIQLLLSIIIVVRYTRKYQKAYEREKK
jgi:hypothetical protein